MYRCSMHIVVNFALKGCPDGGSAWDYGNFCKIGGVAHNAERSIAAAEKGDYMVAIVARTADHDRRRIRARECRSAGPGKGDDRTKASS